jgi:hypothetical protein
MRMRLYTPPCPVYNLRSCQHVSLAHLVTLRALSLREGGGEIRYQGNKERMVGTHIVDKSFSGRSSVRTGVTVHRSSGPGPANAVRSSFKLNLDRTFQVWTRFGPVPGGPDPDLGQCSGLRPRPTLPRLSAPWGQIQEERWTMRQGRESCTF